MMWQCPSCGATNEENFCCACGEPRPQDTQYETNVNEQQMYERSSADEAYAEATVKHNSNLIITIVICATVILAMVLGIGAYVYTTNTRNRLREESAAEKTDVVQTNSDQGAITAQPSPIPSPSATPTPVPKETLPADSTANRSKTNGTAQRENFLSRAEAIEQYSKTNFETASNQVELNRESEAVFRKWDKLLNDVYQYLKGTLSADEFSALKKEETSWVREKEAAIAETGAEWEGGSGRTMAENLTGIDYTSKRCYYLITLIP